MSRRRQSSRRRNYGRRQHEVRERRPGMSADLDFEPRSNDDGSSNADLEDDRSPTGKSDDYEGIRP